jgi:peptide/nickel transport system permease protein
MTSNASTIIDPASQSGSLRRRLTRLSVGEYLAAGFVLILIVAALFPQFLTPFSPLEPDEANVLSAPSLLHPFGTDYLGRDLLSRVIYGTSRTFTGSAIAVLIGLGAGTVLGLLAASFGGFVDAVISRIIDVLLSIPGLLLAMMIVVSLGFGSLNAAVAVGVSSVAMFTRVMRSEVLAVKQLPFVEASNHLGAGRVSVLIKHVLPNSYSPVLSLTALQFGNAILWISALSFLGYGAPPPLPEWGLLVSEGRDYIVSSPWLVLLPGLVITLAVVAISQVSQIVKGRFSR